MIKSDSLVNYLSRYRPSGVYEAQEIYDLIKWIKEYNLSKTHHDRMHFFGIDTQGPYSIASKTSDLLPQLSNVDKESFKDLEELKK